MGRGAAGVVTIEGDVSHMEGGGTGIEGGPTAVGEEALASSL